MNIVSSESLGAEPVRLGELSGELDIYDGLRTPFSEDIVRLSDRHARQLAEFAQKAAELFGDKEGEKEPTRVQTDVGRPSLVVRVDATVIDGDVVPYEMEDSPSGQGITDIIQTAVTGAGIKERILEHYGQFIRDIPYVIVSGARGHGTDDAVIVGDTKYSFDIDVMATPSANDPVIVKAIPGDPSSHEPYLSLQQQAVAPLVTEGDKSYLERFGMLQSIVGPDELLVDSDDNLISQVLKSRLGSMAMGVTMFLTNEDKRLFARAGTVTASKLRSRAEEYDANRGGALVQPFYPPIRLENSAGAGNAILRVFTLLGSGTAEVIGGCYVARSGMIVHGSSDAVTGGVVYNGEQE